MKVHIHDNNEIVELTKKDFLSSGGEGEIYVKNDVAYKIYHKKEKMLSLGKFQELNQLKHPQIIKPEKLLKDYKGNFVGYSMKFIPNSIPLSRLFTNDFRDKNGIENEDIIHLSKQIIDIVTHIHQHECLIVDGNEMNYIVSEDFKNVYFIDTDSYKTKSYPATAYSESTCDPTINHNQFNQLSDWFTIAIVLCNLFVGTHPFKGKYKGNSKNFKMGDFKSRMKEKVSIFNKNVKVNSAVRDFALIPENIYKWFYELFEKGERKKAPETFGKFIKNINYEEIVKQSQKIKFTVISTFEEKIIDAYYFNGEKAIKTKNYFYYKNEKSPYSDPKTELIFTKKRNTPLLLKIKDNFLYFYNLKDKTKSKTNIKCENIFIVNNNLYASSENKIISINILETQNNLLFTIENYYNINKNSTHLFENLLISELPMKKLFIIPEKNKFHIIEFKELNNYKIINSKINNNLLTAIYYKNGNYLKFISLINFENNTYKIIQNEITENLNINDCYMEKGVFAFITKDKEINLISEFDYQNKEINLKNIKDDNLKSTQKLHSNINAINFIFENKEINITLK